MGVETDDVGPEQLRYARLLDIGTRIGFVLLVATFFAYLLGLAPASVALDELPKLWTLPVDQFRAATGSPSGWSWITRLAEGEALNFAAVAFLAAVTIGCYIGMLPMLIRSRMVVFAWLCAIEIVVLVAAAAGWAAGH